MKPSDLSKKMEAAQAQAVKAVQDQMKTEVEQLAKDVRTRTRMGSGVDASGNKSKLKSLSPAYIKQRESLKAKGKLSNVTTPKKSGLTKSGSMLDSLKGTAKGSSFKVEVTGSDDEGNKNSDKALWNAENGREFMNLSNEERTRTVQKLRQKFVTSFKKALK